jgi:hypothetical protein
MIYNLSERKYNVEYFNNQVTDFVFAGFPNPPLETFFIILKELDSWLNADDKHVAIIHCQPSMVLSSVREGVSCSLARMSHYASKNSLIHQKLDNIFAR